jgi:hypothetical protein
VYVYVQVRVDELLRQTVYHLQHHHPLNAYKMLTRLLPPTYLLPRHRLAGLREEDARCPAADITDTVRVTCRFQSQQERRRAIKATGKQSKQSACEEPYEVGEQAN